MIVYYVMEGKPERSKCICFHAFLLQTNMHTYLHIFYYIRMFILGYFKCWTLLNDIDFEIQLLPVDISIILGWQREGTSLLGDYNFQTRTSGFLRK